jgi:hypothetical protein
VHIAGPVENGMTREDYLQVPGEMTRENCPKAMRSHENPTETGSGCQKPLPWQE